MENYGLKWYIFDYRGIIIFWIIILFILPKDKVYRVEIMDMEIFCWNRGVSIKSILVSTMVLIVQVR